MTTGHYHPAASARGPRRWNTPQRPPVTGEGQHDVHTDPSREPALDPAPPADVSSCSTILGRAEIQLRDGSWAGAQAIGQRRTQRDGCACCCGGTPAQSRAAVRDGFSTTRTTSGPWHSIPTGRRGSGPAISAMRSRNCPPGGHRPGPIRRVGAQASAARARRSVCSSRTQRRPVAQARRITRECPGFTPLGRRQRLPAGACLGQRHRSRRWCERSAVSRRCGLQGVAKTDDAAAGRLVRAHRPQSSRRK